MVATQKNYNEIITLFNKLQKKILIESQLDFSTILDNRINTNAFLTIKSFLYSIPKRVIMTQAQIRFLEVLCGDEYKKEIIKTLSPYFINTKKL